MVSKQQPGNHGRIIGLLVVALVVALALLVIRNLHNADELQDCMMQGRSNCNQTISASP